MQPADKPTQRRLGYMEDRIKPKGTFEARREAYRRKMERRQRARHPAPLPNTDTTISHARHDHI
jgi:hypothetical protein